MNEIKLDPKKLLGFKITGENTNAVHSPKIGAKSCTVSDTAALAAVKSGSKI